MEDTEHEPGSVLDLLAKQDIVDWIWDEYKYRHQHIWKTVFSLTGAVVLLSVIPYLYPRVTCVLGIGTGVTLIISIGLWLFGTSRISRELRRFNDVKGLYREYQYEKYKEYGFENSMGTFSRDVMLYLIGLGIISFLNTWIFIYWLCNMPCAIFLAP